MKRGLKLIYSPLHIAGDETFEVNHINMFANHEKVFTSKTSHPSSSSNVCARK